MGRSRVACLVVRASEGLHIYSLHEDQRDVSTKRGERGRGERERERDGGRPACPGSEGWRGGRGRGEPWASFWASCRLRGGGGGAPVELRRPPHLRCRPCRRCLFFLAVLRRRLDRKGSDRTSSRGVTSSGAPVRDPSTCAD